MILVSLVALGLYARAAAFLLSGMMAFAFFFVHVPQGWNISMRTLQAAQLARPSFPP